MKSILLLALALLISMPVYGQTPQGQDNGAPDPLKVAPNGHPLPQADPATIALALTAAPKTPMPTPIEWRGAMRMPKGVLGQTDIVIGTGDGQPLHAEIEYPENPPAGLMPAIIWIHGGAWQGESQHPNSAAYFATRGYFTASIEYRLAPKATWPAQIEDCKLGVRWLRANAAKYHVDPDHIGIWGASAGGHLASCLGTLDDPALEGNGGYPGVRSKVQAVCDWCGPVDFTHGGPRVLFTQDLAQNPAVYASASPFVHIKATQPPFLVMQGDKDPAVPYKDSVDFVAAMLKAGATVEFISVRNAGHSLTPVHGLPAPSMNVSQDFGRMAEFFDKYLKPSGNNH